MAALDFPASPTVGQIFTGGNGVNYQWNGVAWLVKPVQPMTPSIGFFVKNSLTLSLPGTDTQVTTGFDTVVSGNEGGWYSTTTGRFTPPPGRYHIWGTVGGYNAATATLIQVTLRKNGVAQIFGQQVPGTANWSGDPSVEGTFDANGTDYFTLSVFANNGATVSPLQAWFGADSVQLYTPYIPNPAEGFTSGDVKAAAYGSTPTGWYECDGSLKNRTTDAALFAAIGVTWGAGDGSTTFALPDFRGRTLAGVDGGAGRLGSGSAGGITGAATLGATGGQQAHIQATTEVGSHIHYYGVGGVPANGVNVRGTSGDGTNFGYVPTEGPNGSTGAAGNVLQPTAVIRWLIKR